MTEISDKIRAIASAGLEQPLRKSGFQRHSTHFARQFGESLQVINIQSSKWNTKGSGKFTLNVGAHFSKIASLLYGKDPMPANPKESHCIIRARVGMLMPGRQDHWWTVTPETNVEQTAGDVAAACAEHVLPWLNQFASISGTNWKFERFILQHTWAEAAANLVLGDRAKATQCVAEELRRIHSDPAYEHPANAKWKEERLAQLRKWAADQGIAVADQADAN
ncbi:MAG TPA: DUF4304 domain-containing protein [Candidatus Acidoferrum sp.]|nr:DUF4304 domain-containing protein [Candidatus Acidoferrum sp.]